MFVPYTNYISDFIYCTNSINEFRLSNSLSTCINIHGITFEERSGNLFVDTHDMPINETASNLLEFVVQKFKENGYKLTKDN